VDQKISKSPPYHLEFIIRYDKKGAFNHKKNFSLLFLQIINKKKNRIQLPKMNKFLFPAVLPEFWISIFINPRSPHPPKTNFDSRFKKKEITISFDFCNVVVFKLALNDNFWPFSPVLIFYERQHQEIFL